MINVSKITNCPEFTIYCDEIIPLRIAFQEGARLRYSRHGNGLNSFVEVALDGLTGQISELVVVSYPTSGVQSINRDEILVAKKVGVPCFDRAEWGEKMARFVDNFSPDFRINLGLDFLQIVFEASGVSRTFGYEGLVFGVNGKEELCVVQIELSAEEQRCFLVALE